MFHPKRRRRRRRNRGDGEDGETNGIIVQLRIEDILEIQFQSGNFDGRWKRRRAGRRRNDRCQWWWKRRRDQRGFGQIENHWIDGIHIDWWGKKNRNERKERSISSWRERETNFIRRHFVQKAFFIQCWTVVRQWRSNGRFLFRFCRDGWTRRCRCEEGSWRIGWRGRWRCGKSHERFLDG